ncbi:hypothetical protein F7734_41400 [Scytonema sp. UIC 10036]|uniref:hypothetical protein n=1 Tax=Scytonema sp. UIC 10036 TaxID=2304196 RepID=UPI0012DAAA0E|nr:hypothetical protein [Scytonema sp. UIC 10036]MUG98419.1 hypothetical protein [Scytonema sp. UIC 10036]
MTVNNQQDLAIASICICYVKTLNAILGIDTFDVNNIDRALWLTCDCTLKV